ncbi:two-component system nitrate/nitrite response regulator NarL [Kribbella aluminosa]|uniref:Two-component system nitrate/nitrite response regulator NarL n=1 Tax=Kribbella aluminosa TaxID=416017 RepID=A0ABS4UV94_9ACTN|nr:response regulator transcription factor [Kribbella aluminosa]MBP2355553.1 two-component system nitrate/nitrite response regulator NarL [Kribbella aluminosa]
MSGPDGIAVLLVDDHRVFAEALGSLLAAEAGISEVSVASNLDTARTLIAAGRPDIVLLDLSLAEESGNDLLAELANDPAPTAVVMLSGSTDPRSIVQALEAGARGWLSKTTKLSALVEALWQVLDGNVYLSPATLQPVLRHLMSDVRRQRAASGFVDQLTHRELDVLRCLVSGMTRAEAAAHLFVSTNTIRTHIQSLLRRSGQHSTLALVAFARSHGVTGIDETEGSVIATGPGSSA